MVVPFRIQATEYDCVPTTFTNALIYLFKRSEIPPLVIQRIYIYCLDYMEDRKSIAHGTTSSAIQLLANWLNTFKSNKFKLDVEYCSGESVHMGKYNKITKSLKEKAAVLLNVSSSKNESHYILALYTENSDGRHWVYCFDPYPKKSREGFEYFNNCMGQEPNLRIDSSHLDVYSNNHYNQLGSKLNRECIIMKRAVLNG